MFFVSPDEIKLIRLKTPFIDTARKFTASNIAQMRAATLSAGFPSDTLVVANGSYARGEASSESDLDFLVICNEEADVSKAKIALDQVGPKLLEIAGKPHGEDGAFGTVESIGSMLLNIGGNEDSNRNITRRVLFLLEGEWLLNEPGLASMRGRLIGAYVKESITSHQIALFLLNDIIRYYRTICVDFEFKTVGNTKGLKPWGTRNIKLIFSRKILYFSGVLAVAATAQSSYSEKIKTLCYLFSLPVVDRVLACCGEKAVPALKLYNFFMEEMSKPETRQDLDYVTIENKEKSDCFRGLKDCGHHFSWELLLLLQNTFEASHPIHRSLIL